MTHLLEPADFEDHPEASVGFHAGLAAAEPKTVPLDLTQTVAALVPQGFQLQQIGGERWQAKPDMVRGKAELHTLDAFVEYVSTHADDRTTVWADVPNRRLEAVLDDHTGLGTNATGHEPGWGAHRAVVQLEHSPEWKRWTDNDTRRFPQQEFATFIEDYVDDLSDPIPATMLELARTFHAKKDVKFASAVHTQSGTVQLENVEKVEAGAGKAGAPIEIPEFLTLALSVFDGGPKYAVKARFLYRIDEGKLFLSYRLLKLEDIVRHAFANEEDGIVPRLQSEFDRVYLGKPIRDSRHGS